MSPVRAIPHLFNCLCEISILKKEFLIKIILTNAKSDLSGAFGFYSDRESFDYPIKSWMEKIKILCLFLSYVSLSISLCGYAYV